MLDTNSHTPVVSVLFPSSAPVGGAAVLRTRDRTPRCTSRSSKSAPRQSGQTSSLPDTHHEGTTLRCE